MSKKIPESTIDEVLSRADIESVVGEYVTFQKRSGSDLFACCPFHSEKTPSFSVSPSRQIYYCFGCHKGGNAINFIMELEHLSYPEAIRFLGNKLGIDVPVDDYGRDNDKTVKDKKKRISALLNESARYFYLCLNSTNNISFFQMHILGLYQA
jgi:DNA primase